MTLEQVRYEISALNAGGSYVPHGSLSKWADAIDAHLARQSEGVSDELPDDIRVPLDEVRADLGYLFGRVAADGSFMQAAMDSARLKLDKVSAALTAVWHNRPAQEKAEPVAKCVGVIEEIDEDTNSVLVEWSGPISCGDNLYTATPAERVRVPADAEAVSACLGDDAAAMLETNAEDERALNMQRAAQIIDAMISAAPEADHG